LELPVTVVKNDGHREPFSRAKLQRGIEIACNKRPISQEKIEEVVETIEGEIQDLGEREVPSKLIGELVIKHLRELDEVAYVRFASVYRKFQDTEEFLSELQNLKKRESETS